ncbi:MAG: hypothetical protein AAF236_11120 [Verrucomicrobiota bacterium]
MGKPYKEEPVTLSKPLLVKVADLPTEITQLGTVCGADEDCFFPEHGAVCHGRLILQPCDADQEFWEAVDAATDPIILTADFYGDDGTTITDSVSTTIDPTAGCLAASIDIPMGAGYVIVTVTDAPGDNWVVGWASTGC